MLQHFYIILYTITQWQMYISGSNYIFVVSYYKMIEVAIDQLFSSILCIILLEG